MREPRIQPLTPGSFDLTLPGEGLPYRLRVQSVGESLRQGLAESPTPGTLILCFPAVRTVPVSGITEALGVMHAQDCHYAVLADWTWEDRPDVLLGRKLDQARGAATPARETRSTEARRAQ